jgi:hypothetical protein
MWMAGTVCSLHATISVHLHPALGSLAAVLDFAESIVSGVDHAIEAAGWNFEPQALDHAERVGFGLLVCELVRAACFPHPKPVAGLSVGERSLVPLSELVRDGLIHPGFVGGLHYPPRLRLGPGQNGTHHWRAEKNRAIGHSLLSFSARMASAKNSANLDCLLNQLFLTE